MNKRELAIQGFLKEAYRLWATNSDRDLDQARYLERQATRFETMSDEDFDHEFVTDYELAADVVDLAHRHPEKEESE